VEGCDATDGPRCQDSCHGVNDRFSEHYYKEKSMKIAFITNSFPVLYNSFTANEIAQLVQRGVDVSILSLRRRAGGVSNEVSLALSNRALYLADFLKKRDGRIRIRKTLLLAEGRIRRLSPWLYDRLGQMMFGIKGGKPEDKQYRSLLGWNWHALEEVASLLRRGGYELIHAGFGNRPAEAAMILSRLSGLPFTFEAHAYDLFVDFPFAEQKLAEAASIFTISHYNSSYLVEELGCRPEKIALMRVTFNREHCDRVTHIQKDPNLIVAVCRLHPIKGLGDAIEAISLVARTNKQFRFVIVGTGPLEAELKAKVRTLGLEKYVIFQGSVGNEKALELMASAGILLLPSVIAPDGDRDGIPTSMIEAMYLRTPVVSTRVSGIPELVDDGINGFLTEPGDIEKMADRVRQLLNDNDLRSSMGAKARDKIERDFYERDTVDILMGQWRKILGSAQKADKAGSLETGLTSTPLKMKASE